MSQKPFSVQMNATIFQTFALKSFSMPRSRGGGGSGQKTETTDREFVVCHLLAFFNDPTERN